MNLVIQKQQQQSKQMQDFQAMMLTMMVRSDKNLKLTSKINHVVLGFLHLCNMLFKLKL